MSIDLGNHRTTSWYVDLQVSLRRLMNVWLPTVLEKICLRVRSESNKQHTDAQLRSLHILACTENQNQRWMIYNSLAVCQYLSSPSFPTSEEYISWMKCPQVSYSLIQCSAVTEPFMLLWCDTQPDPNTVSRSTHWSKSTSNLLYLYLEHNAEGFDLKLFLAELKTPAHTAKHVWLESPCRSCFIAH